MCGHHDNNNNTGLVTNHDSDKIITIEPHITPTSTIILGNHELKIIMSLKQLKQRGLVTADEKIRKIDKYKFMIDLQCGLSLTWVEGC